MLWEKSKTNIKKGVNKSSSGITNANKGGGGGGGGGAFDASSSHNRPVISWGSNHPIFQGPKKQTPSKPIDFSLKNDLRHYLRLSLYITILYTILDH